MNRTITYTEAQALSMRHQEVAAKAARDGRPRTVRFTSGNSITFTIEDARVINGNTETIHRATCHLARSTARSANLGFVATVEDADRYEASGYTRCRKCN